MGVEQFTDEVLSIVRASLLPPGDMSGGSVLAERTRDEWRAELALRWLRAVQEARRGNPELTRLLELVGAEMRFHDPDTSKRLSIVPTPNGGWAVTAISSGVER